MPTIAIVLCKYVLAIALVRIVYLYYLNHCVHVNSWRKWTITCFNPNLLECGGDMRPQRKIMMVETTYAFVKLKHIKAAVSAGGIKFNLYDFLFPNMQLEFLKYFWTSSSGSPKFARVARKNSAWLRPQRCLSWLRNKDKDRTSVWLRIFPADLAKRRCQNNVKNNY